MAQYVIIDLVAISIGSGNVIICNGNQQPPKAAIVKIRIVANPSACLADFENVAMNIPKLHAVAVQVATIAI